MIEAGLASPGELTPAFVSDLKSQISSLPEDRDASQSAYLSLGMRSAKQDLLSLLDEIERGPSHLKDELRRIKKQVDKRAARLEDGTR